MNEELNTAKVKYFQLVKTPWCSSNALIPREAVALAEQLVSEYTGTCPSGVTFNSMSFWKEMQIVYPQWAKRSIGKVSSLPWGLVSDAIIFGPPNEVKNCLNVVL